MSRKVVNRPLIALGVVGGALLLVLLAVVATSRVELLQSDGEPTTLMFSGQATVPPNQVHDAVLIGRGRVLVAGEVEGDVTVIDGQARVTGVVRGDVTVLRGEAILGPDAVVGGDLSTSMAPQIDPEAAVGGAVTRTSLADLPGLLPRPLWLGLWLTGGLAVLALVLAAPQVAHDGARAGRRRPLRSLLAGGAALVLLPLLLTVLALTLIGIGVAVLLAAVAIVAVTVGVGVATSTVGRLMLAGDGRVPLVAGWVMSGAVLILALLLSPVVAAALTGLLAAFGLGALLSSRLAGPADVPPTDDDDAPSSGVGADDPFAWDTRDLEEPVAATAAPGEAHVIAALPILNGAGRAGEPV